MTNSLAGKVGNETPTWLWSLSRVDYLGSQNILISKTHYLITPKLYKKFYIIGHWGDPVKYLRV
jgi:hypothetical protein